MNGHLVNEATPYAIVEKVKGVMWCTHVSSRNLQMQLTFVDTSLLSSLKI